MLDVDYVRSQFPALESEWVFFDNGGGSQMLRPVLDRIQEYLLTSNVQHGASYELSVLAADRVQRATEAMAILVNAADPSELVMGSSTSGLLRMLATGFGERLEPGDEIVVSESDHEANISPWVELERTGAVIRHWRIDPETRTLRMEGLERLLGPQTRLVAVTHASNILGTANPIRPIADAVHDRGALLCIDGVAYAPHRAIDVRALDVDFYAFSFYKTFGPHQAVLYGKRAHLLDLPVQNHSFIRQDDVPYKLQPGGINYELTYGLLGLTDYLGDLAARSTSGPPEPANGATSRTAVTTAFGAIAEQEAALCSRLLDYLRDQTGVRIQGIERGDAIDRLPIVSFAVDGIRSPDVVRAVDAHRIGIRYGHFYSPRLIEALGLPREDGVVRVSMAHYNTLGEVDRLIEALQPIVGSA